MSRPYLVFGSEPNSIRIYDILCSLKHRAKLRHPLLSVPHKIIARNILNWHRSTHGQNWSALCDAPAVQEVEYVVFAGVLDGSTQASILSRLGAYVQTPLKVGLHLSRNFFVEVH